jgi:hypothetical protein
VSPDHAGPAVSVRAPDSDAQDSDAQDSDAPVAAEVVEVLGSGPGELALLEVAAPGFVVPLRPAPASAVLPGSPLPPRAIHDELLRFRRFGAAGPKFGGAERREGESSTVTTASIQAGGARHTASDQRSAERGALLLAYLREHARTGRLDPVVTVPALEGPR